MTNSAQFPISSDVIVIGVGGMGSATCYQLAKAGARVVGLEQYALGHAFGSSHGETRLIRQAYFEHPSYVPLLQRSYQLWKMAEAESQKPLLHQTGLVIFGREQCSVLSGIKRSSKLYGIPIDTLSAQDARRQYSQFKVPEDFIGLYEPTGGYLEVEACVLTHAALARKHGAEIHENTQVLGWNEEKGRVVVRTNSGTYTAAHLVITAGPWSRTLLESLNPVAAHSLKVRRVPQFWFGAADAYTLKQSMPCFAFDTENGFFYGFPRLDEQMKIAFHIPGELVPEPEKVNRNLVDADVHLMADFIQKYLPGVRPKVLRQAVCMYTMTPDEHFIIDRQGLVTYAAGFSGHGFKFSSVIGEILSQLALLGSTTHPIDFLRPQRLQ